MLLCGFSGRAQEAGTPMHGNAAHSLDPDLALATIATVAMAMAWRQRLCNVHAIA